MQRTTLGTAILLTAIGSIAGLVPAWGAIGCSPSGTNATSTTCTQNIAITTSTTAGGSAASGNFYPSIITVPANTLSGTVQTVTLNLNLSHTAAIGDLGFLLVSPSGKAMVVMGLGGNFTPGTNLAFNIKDVNASPMPCDGSTAMPAGSYKPTACLDAANWNTLYQGFPADAGNGWAGCTSACPLAAPAGTLTMNGIFGQETSPNGNWKLYVRDEASLGGAGTVNSWGLVITTSGVSSSATTTTLSTPSPQTVLRTTPGASDATTLSVTLTPSNITGGTVTFTDNGGATACTATVTGTTASCNATFSTEGIHQITAVYGGTANFATSTAPGSVFVMVNNRSTITGLTSTAGQFCNSGGVSLPISTAPLVYPSNIFVTTNGSSGGPNAYSGVITGLAVTLNGFTHTIPSSSEFLLVSPAGKAFVLLANAFQSGAASNANITFSDAGASLAPQSGSASTAIVRPADWNVSAATDFANFVAENTLASTVFNPTPAPTSGYFFPSGTGFGSTTLGQAFGGDSANGNWKLYAINAVTGTAGSISGWCMNFTINPSAAATTTSVSANPVQVFTNAPTQQTTITATVTSGGSTVSAGSVTFTDNGIQLTCTNSSQPVAVSAGMANCTVASFATQGNHNITATYNPGGAAFGPSFGVGVVRVDFHSTPTINGSTISYCNSGTTTFPGISNQAGPASPYPSNIIITDLSGTINSTTVTFNNYVVATGSAAHDFTALLVGPTGGNAAAFDFFSRVGGTAANFSASSITLSDVAGSALPGSTIGAGIYRPTSLSGPNSYAALSPAGPYPPPAGPYNYAASTGASTFTSMFGSGTSNTASGNGTWSLYAQTVGNGTSGSFSSWCMNFIQNAVTGTGTTSHVGPGTGNHMLQGGTGTVTFSLTNNGFGPTGDFDQTVAHAMTVSGTLPSGLTLGTVPTGTPWNCVAGSSTQVTCTNMNAIAQGSTYQLLSLPVNVASGAPSTVTVSGFTFSGAGMTAGTFAGNIINIDAAPSLSIAKSHTGTFTQGQTGGGSGDGAFTFVVSNAAGTSATSGTITITDTLPIGWAAVGYGPTGPTGWACIGGGNPSGNTVTCNYTASIAAGGSAPTLTLNISVPTTSQVSVNNTAKVFGGGDLVHNNSTNAASSNTDSVTVVQVPASMQLTGNNQSTTVGTPFGTNLAVTVMDAGNVAIPNQTVTFTAPGTGASGKFPGSSLTATPTTNPSGVATAGAFTANGIAGGYSVTVVAGSLNQNFSLTNSVAATSKFLVSAPSSATAGTAVAVTATAQDVFGNTVTTYNNSVHFSTTDGAAILPANGAGFTNGVLTKQVTFNTAGPQTVTVADTTASSINGISSSVNVSGVPALQSATPNSGQQGATNLSVAIVGAFTHFVNGTSTVSFSASGVSGTLAVTDANHATATVSISSGATLGAGNITVTTGAEVVALTNGFTVTSGAVNVPNLAGLTSAAASSALTTAGLTTGTVTTAYSSTVAAGLVISQNPLSGVSVALNSAVNFVVSLGPAPTLTVTSLKVLWGSQSYETIGTLRNRLPWKITGIQVTFSAPVVSGTVNSLGGVTATAFSGLGTNTLTWTVNPLTLGNFSLTLAGTGGNALASSAVALGGGAGYSQALKVLAGDYNDDGVVNAADQVLVNNLRSAAYDILGDMNGDGIIAISDVQLVRTFIGNALP